MRATFYDDSEYRKKQAEITHRYWQSGIFDFKRKPLQTRNCKYEKCQFPFQVESADAKVFCSHRCAAIVNNSKRPKKYYFCISCKESIQRPDRKYCSVKCQWRDYHSQYVTRWKQGLEDGSRGINTRGISGHLRHYLLQKYQGKCSECGWDKINPYSGRVILEVDHIDGNSENNKEENLRLLCPNCHSLTPTFKNLNKGNGRAWRLKNSII